MSRTAIRPITPNVIGITGRLGSRTRHERIHATAIAKPGLRNSDGCRLKPIHSQRLAPFTSLPSTGTRTSATSMAAARMIASRRVVSFGRSEATNMASSPTVSQRKWIQKK